MADTDALLYLPGRDQAKLRVALQIPALSPGWQGSFRDLLSPADGGGDRRGTPGAGLARLPEAARRQGRRGKRARCPRSTSPPPTAPRLPAARAGQYLTLRITGAGQPAPVRSYSLSSAPRRRHLPDQRQARGARRRQQLPEPQPATGSGPGRGRAARRLRPRRRRRPGPAHLGRHRRHAGPVDAAPAGRGPQRARHLVAARGARAAASIPSRPRHTPCWPRCRTPASTCSTARPHSPSASVPTPPPGASPNRHWPGWASRPARAPTSAGRPSFMADMRDALTAIGLDPAAIHTELFGALPLDQPRDHRAGQQRRRTSHRARRAPGRWSPSPAAASPRPSATTGAACSTSPTPATSPPGGAAATGVCHTCVTPLLSGDITLRPGPARTPSRRAGAHLLRPAQHRHRGGHVGGNRHDDTTPREDT